MAEITEKKDGRTEKQFENTRNNHKNKVFNIQPADNAHVRFSYRLPNVKPERISTGSKKMEHTRNKKNEPEYFLNFVFNNYRNPKETVDPKTLSKKVQMRRAGRRLLRNGIPNPYKYFPLKGEDM
ncbi:uncharacterized protein LOC108099292 [Drosophila ficusphila]|uniref:uncharacterized protein LOC108099292 n=1 Tax=Drosophila ficusphila TaxID=30025 RepID=UPI0007E8AB3B|nr:uncharacterized protein LOC108099292 [Drosophila ficusphila]